MKKVIKEGEKIPHYPWYLPSYDEFRMNCNYVLVTCYPIGIHLVVMYFRKLIHWLHWNCRPLTEYDKLDYANSRIEYLVSDNKRLKEEIRVLENAIRRITNEDTDLGS